jgi:hypothetical protein
MYELVALDATELNKALTDRKGTVEVVGVAKERAIQTAKDNPETPYGIFYARARFFCPDTLESLNHTPLGSEYKAFNTDLFPTTVEWDEGAANITVVLDASQLVDRMMTTSLAHLQTHHQMQAGGFEQWIDQSRSFYTLNKTASTSTSAVIFVMDLNYAVAPAHKKDLQERWCKNKDAVYYWEISPAFAKTYTELSIVASPLAQRLPETVPAASKEKAADLFLRIWTTTPPGKPAETSQFDVGWVVESDYVTTHSKEQVRSSLVADLYAPVEIVAIVTDGSGNFITSQCGEKSAAALTVSQGLAIETLQETFTVHKLHEALGMVKLSTDQMLEYFVQVGQRSLVFEELLARGLNPSVLRYDCINHGGGGFWIVVQIFIDAIAMAEFVQDQAQMQKLHLQHLDKDSLVDAATVDQNQTTRFSVTSLARSMYDRLPPCEGYSVIQSIRTLSTETV